MANKVKKESVIKIFAVLIVFAGLIAGVVTISRMLNINTNASEVTTYATTRHTAPEMSIADDNNKTKNYAIQDDIEIILIMGVDDRENRGETNSWINSSQADFLNVLAINHKNKSYQILQINRDTMADVQTYTMEGQKYNIEQMQICLSHSYGKTDQGRCLNTVDAVSTLIFDVPIKHYIALNMSSIAVLNDQVGGVTITMPEGLEEADPDFKAGETIKLTGTQAEKFVRARYVLKDDHNSLRMERQVMFLKAWKDLAKTKMNEDNGFSLKLVLAVSEYMTSDMTANSLSELANLLKDYNDLGTLTPEGKYIEADDDHIYREFHVDKDDLKKKVIELCYKEKTTE